MIYFVLLLTILQLIRNIEALLASLASGLRYLSSVVDFDLSSHGIQLTNPTALSAIEY